MYDLIGDIHGHADALQQLLKQLGCSRIKSVYLLSDQGTALHHLDRRACRCRDYRNTMRGRATVPVNRLMTF